MTAGVRLDIRGDTKKLTRNLTKLQRTVVPKATSKAINEIAVNARSRAIKEVAKEQNLPQKVIRKRLDARGNVKGDRSFIRKAKPKYLQAEIEVNTRGVPAIQLVTRAQQIRSITKSPKGGVRAYGGRRYRRGFVAEGRGNSVQLFARRTRARYPLGVIKVGVRRALVKSYDEHVINSGPEYRKRFNRLLNYELKRIGQ